MLRNTINQSDDFSIEEKEILLKIVENVYFYWNKFELLNDAIDMVRSFFKPTPISYYSPLSEYPRLDRTINYNAYVVAFINTAAFFESKKSRKDDRLLCDFLDECKSNVSILFRLKQFLLKKHEVQVKFTEESLLHFIVDSVKTLQDYTETDAVLEIKKYRHKVLSHHTAFNESDIDENVSDYLMDAQKFLYRFISYNLSEILTQKYNSINKPIVNEVDLLRIKVKPDLKDIISGSIKIPIANPHLKEELKAHPLYEELLTCFTNYQVHENASEIKIDYTQINSFYDKKSNGGINDNGKLAAIDKIVKLLHIEGIKLSAKIVDQPPHK